MLSSDARIAPGFRIHHVRLLLRPGAIQHPNRGVEAMRDGLPAPEAASFISCPDCDRRLSPTRSYADRGLRWEIESAPGRMSVRFDAHCGGCGDGFQVAIEAGTDGVRISAERDPIPK